MDLPVFWKTPAFCRENNFALNSVVGLIRYGKIAPPAKDSSGDYVWTVADVERVRQALAAGRRKRTPRVPAAEVAHV